LLHRAFFLSFSDQTEKMKSVYSIILFILFLLLSCGSNPGEVQPGSSFARSEKLKKHPQKRGWASFTGSNKEPFPGATLHGDDGRPAKAVDAFLD
jgi:hypothetical protein